ncbi:MAG TPA: TadE/TadG family type IV pilus assembly protein [Pirellulales bacterium]
MSRRRNKSGRRGAELVELAMVMPVMLMIVIGIVEFGRAFEAAQLLTAAAREGARLGMLYNVVKERDRAQNITTANQKVKVDIKNFLAAAGLKTTNLKVYIQDVGTSPGNFATTPDIDLENYGAGGISEKYFRIQVQIPYKDVSYIGSPMWLNGATLYGDIVVRHE